MQSCPHVYKGKRGRLHCTLAAAVENELLRTRAENDARKESIRCMGIAFDDIASMVNLPKNQYGDPDALMNAIEAIQDENEELKRAIRYVFASGQPLLTATAIKKLEAVLPQAPESEK